MAEAKSLAEFEEWAQLVKEQERDSPESFVHLNALFPKLTEPQISSLAHLFATGLANEKYAAGLLLLWMMRRQDARLKGDLLPGIALSAQELVNSEYPHTRLGARGFAVLELADSAAAERFVLSLDPTEYTGDELVYYFGALEVRSTAAKVERLRDLERRGGDLGSRATKSLGNLGMLSATQIAELAKRFRSEPTAEHLSKLFHVYVRFLIGKPLQPLMELLGEPEKREVYADMQRAIYRSKDGRAVVVLFFRGDTISDVSNKEPERW